MDPKIKEELKELEEDVKDYSRSVDSSKKDLEQARIWFSEAVLDYARAIVKLRDFQRKNELPFTLPE